MNKERLIKVADFIDGKVDTGFNMADCCGCIAARTFEFAMGEKPDWRWFTTQDVAKNFLGLTDDETKKLFRPDFITCKDYDDGRGRDKALAVRVMRRAARLGKIIWR